MSPQPWLRLKCLCVMIKGHTIRAHTFNHASTPSVACLAMYHHNKPPTPSHTPCLIAYRVAPLPQPAAAPPFPQCCNYIREPPHGPEQLQRKRACTFLSVCLCACHKVVWSYKSDRSCVFECVRTFRDLCVVCFPVTEPVPLQTEWVINRADA